MTAKEYLNQIRNYENRIQRIQDEIQRLEAVATNVSPSLSGMPHNPSQTTSRMADAVCKIIDKENELRQELAKLEAIRKEATVMISQLDNQDERTVLYKRYLESKSWDDIALELGFCERQIYRIHKAALTKIAVPD